jgi:hypothetical protein
LGNNSNFFCNTTQHNTELKHPTESRALWCQLQPDSGEPVLLSLRREASGSVEFPRRASLVLLLDALERSVGGELVAPMKSTIKRIPLTVVHQGATLSLIEKYQKEHSRG